MFFLLSSLFISKYYPNIIAQFAVGCFFYLIGLMIVNDFIKPKLLQKYRYHMIIIVLIDLAYLLYHNNNYKNEDKPIQKKIILEVKKQSLQDVPQSKEDDTLKLPSKEDKTTSISLSSINYTSDKYSIKHEQSPSSSDGLFLIDDIPSDKKEGNETDE